MTKKKAALFSTLGVLVLAIIAVAFFIGGDKAQSPSLKIEKNFGHKEKKVKVPNITFNGVGAVTVNKDNVSYTKLHNPKNNPCYFKYKITLQETGKVLYESDYLEPGKTIYSEKMTEQLKPGKYRAFLSIETRGLEEPHAKYNGLKTLLTITVQ